MNGKSEGKARREIPEDLIAAVTDDKDDQEYLLDGENKVGVADAPEQGFSLRTEICMFLNLSIPTTCSNILGQAQWLISSIFCGTHLGSTPLAAMILANVAGNLVGKSFAYGLLSAGDTLSGRAYGEKNFAEIGLLAQRGAFLIGVVWVVVSILWLNIEHVLIALGQPPEVIELAARFLKLYTLVFPPEMLAEVFKSFYRCQNICIPFTYITFLAVCCHLGFVSFLIPIYGFDGLIYSHIATAYSTVVMSLVYMIIWKQHEESTWDGINFSKAVTMDGIKDYLKLGIPGILGMSEWWFWECQTVMVGSLGSVPLAAHSIAFNLFPLSFHLYYGPAIAMQTRLSTVLAEKRFKLGKKLVYSLIAVNSCVAVTLSFFFWHLREVILSWFLNPDKADSEAVMEQLAGVWHIVSLFTILDGLLATNFGIYRGAGMHSKLGYFMAAILWTIGFPLELYITYETSFGLRGLYVGMFSIYSLLISVLFMYALCIKWPPKEAL